MTPAHGSGSGNVAGKVLIMDHIRQSPKLLIKQDSITN